MPDKVLLLDHHQIEPILKRMALQIVENNLDAKELIVAGIKERGVDIANMLVAVIKQVSSLKIPGQRSGHSSKDQVPKKKKRMKRQKSSNPLKK